MNKIMTLSAAGITVLSLFAASCKKSDDTKTRHDMLVGTWSLTQNGVDSNNNGTLDASEKHNVTGSDTSTTVFAANGTGTVSGNLSGSSITLPIQWNLQNNDNDLRIIYNFFGTNDTSVVEIKTLDASTLVIRDASTTPPDFSVFTKK